MKPEFYKDYSTVFDAFSHPSFSPTLLGFYLKLRDVLPQGAHVVEVGGGTGLYTKMLLGMRPDLRLTFVEPAPEMIAQVRERLQPPHVLMQATLEEVLPAIEQQDTFIFCRSLYAFYGQLEHYRPLVAQLREKLRPGGQVCILELGRKFDVDQYEQISAERLAGKPDELEQFRERWPILKRAMQEYNAGVEQGVYTLFSPADLRTLFTSAGFEEQFCGRLPSTSSFISVFRLPR